MSIPIHVKKVLSRECFYLALSAVPILFYYGGVDIEADVGPMQIMVGSCAVYCVLGVGRLLIWAAQPDRTWHLPWHRHRHHRRSRQHATKSETPDSKDAGVR